ncbi:peptidase inhibitor family I36 protein [Streptomyces globisporus]|nr:peptidase inhibitor family I36 protein [Streptomyces globisporus]
MIGNKTRRLMASGAAALLLAAGGVLAGAAPASAAYSDCPHGRACFFSDWNGTGSWGSAPGCGTYYLGQWAGTVSSIKTHGNAIRLLDGKNNSVGYVPAWTSTNLSAAENDKAQWIWVIC